MLGASASVVGSLAGILSRSTNTEADTRYWGSLPKYIEIEAYQTPHEYPARELKATTADKPRPVLLSGNHHTCSFDYAREFSALDATHGGTGNPSPWPAEPVEVNRTKANEAFRTMLRSTF
jgi:hypothetical protein